VPDGLLATAYSMTTPGGGIWPSPGVGAEETFAHRRPLITGIGDLVEKLAQPALAGPDRRLGAAITA
jgi:hypothetical protein